MLASDHVGDASSYFISIRPGRDGYESTLIAILGNLLGLMRRRFGGVTGFHQFERPHGSETANVAYDFKATLPILCASPEMVANSIGPHQQIFTLEHIQHGVCGSAGKWIPGKR